MDLRPVERQTLAQAVMQQLLEYIQGGQLRPGDALPSQSQLAATLSVSRPVLREAMRGLAALGIVEIRPGSGSYVRASDGDTAALVDVFSHETALEVLEARMVIEVESAVFAAERATDEDLARMAEALHQIEDAITRGNPTVGASSEFHRLLTLAAHNTVLHRLAELLRQPSRVGGIRVERALPDIVEHEFDNHRTLFEAISSHNRERAREVMRKHLEIAHDWEYQIATLRRTAATARGGAGDRRRPPAGPARLRPALGSGPPPPIDSKRTGA